MCTNVTLHMHCTVHVYMSFQCVIIVHCNCIYSHPSLPDLHLYIGNTSVMASLNGHNVVNALINSGADMNLALKVDQYKISDYRSLLLL